jgi:hypothetical protein
VLEAELMYHVLKIICVRFFEYSMAAIALDNFVHNNTTVETQ